MQTTRRLCTLLSIAALFLFTSLTWPLPCSDNTAWAGSRPEAYTITRDLQLYFQTVRVEGVAYANCPQYSLMGNYDLRRKGWGPQGGVIVNNYGDPIFRGYVYMCNRKIANGAMDFQEWGFQIPYNVSAGRSGSEGVIEYRPVLIDNGWEWEAYYTGTLWLKLGWPHNKVEHRVESVKIDENGSFKVKFWKVWMKTSVVRFTQSWGWDK